MLLCEFSRPLGITGNNAKSVVSLTAFRLQRTCFRRRHRQTLSTDEDDNGTSIEMEDMGEEEEAAMERVKSILSSSNIGEEEEWTLEGEDLEADT